MKHTYKLIATLIAILNCSIGEAQNPIVQTNYTADPAPMVYNDTVFLYTSHDEDDANADGKGFKMLDWLLYTSTDMVNWTEHGIVASLKDFSWAKQDNGAWAVQCIERNGKFYLYCPLHGGGIGVLVSDSPYGPFKDTIGKRLINSDHNWNDIDPTPFIDDDGQAYLYWGNPGLYYVKLNEDMTSYSGEVKQIPNTIESFGKREGEKNDVRPTTYEEGPWLYKRDSLYYLFFAAGPIPEHIGYSTSKNITGPWKYQGVVMPTQGGSFTNHPGIIDFKGKSYFFYHNSALPGGGGFTRSVCVEEAKFNKDGSIVQMNMTEGIKQSLNPLNPYIKTEAETIAWSEGVKSMKNNVDGNFITAKYNDAFTKVKEVDFGKEGASKFTARIGTTHNGNVSMEIRLDTKDGELLGTLNVPMTGGNDRWALQTIDVKKASGIHDLYFVFKGNEGDLFNFNWWKFDK
ncbi:MAG TPA: carbohydrate-binding protein [Marinilabiliales bacterium]|nr:carbohydrate-binding protein [Marinilabiliales bacterium]